MKRALVAFLFLLASSVANAQTVLVRSGEHADFSRIVVAAGTPGDWVFGRVENGYELRLRTPGVEFDSSRVFDLIPRTRIVNVSTPGPGRLRLELGCRCSGDAFAMADGRIVIDISDSPPRPGSPFETMLADPAPEPAPEQSPEPAPAAPAESDPAPPPQNDTASIDAPAQPPSNLPRDVRETSLFDLPEQATLKTADADPAPVSATPDLTLALLADARAAARIAVPDVSPTLPDAPPIDPPVRENTPTADPWTPDRQAELFLGGYTTRFQRVAETRNALLRQLSRAAAQGVIKVAGPTLEAAAQSNGPAPPQPEPAMPDEPSPPVESGDPVERHLNITTVVDRDKPVQEGLQGLTDEGRACLSPELTDVAAWGPDDPTVSPLDSLRATLVLEFDKPNPTAIATLAKRYIYLGFGAEAKALIKAFDVDLENRDILMQLAEIMDAGQVAGPGPLPDQVSCRTEAAMWGVLAVPNIRAGVDIDRKAVLRAFSALPPHLRELLGPTLADHFLGARDIETATTIRNLIDRALGERDAGFKILEASIDSQEGDTQAAIDKLQTVAMEGGPREAEAVASLLEAKLKTGAPISESTALLAESLAVEYRGTALGRRLTRAAILGFAKSGRIAATFERINIALERGDLDQAEADELRLATHLHNAKESSDVDFLTNFFANRIGADALTGDGRATRRAIAERLLSLGLPETALSLYGSTRTGLEEPDQLLLARANLAVGRTAEAQKALQGLEGPEAEMLAAKALEKQRDFEGAAKIYSKLDLAPDAASAAWRAGDFARAAESGPSGFQTAAALALDAGGASADPAPSAAPGDPAKAAAQGMIARGRALLDKSATTRQIIQDLLVSN